MLAPIAAGEKWSSWPEIALDGDVLLTPYVPKGITGYDDDDDGSYSKLLFYR
jgi:succinate dehydrogenase flavin-adding protein (antitoxin of CptAB toxin-antitoxin module)